jgi:hypothetical protein
MVGFKARLLQTRNHEICNLDFILNDQDFHSLPLLFALLHGGTSF